MSGQTLSSVANAARVLKAFSSSDRELGVSELARRLGLGKSTVHRLLVTLAAEQLLDQNPETGKYRLGLSMYELGTSVATNLGLHEAVVPPMAELRRRTQETVQVGVLDGREVVYVERLDAPTTLEMFMRIGHRNAANSTSSGKTLLAHLPKAQLDRTLDGWELPVQTNKTISDASALQKELKRVREQGYAHNISESELGVVSAAAPIRDRTGTVIAALSCAGPEERIAPALHQLTQAVVEGAAVASRRLGHRR